MIYFSRNRAIYVVSGAQNIEQSEKRKKLRGKVIVVEIFFFNALRALYLSVVK